MNKLERMMKEIMDFQNIKYIFLIIGGGWSFCHSLYAITNDNSVLYTDKFDTIETAQPEFVFKLDEELDFSKHTNNVGFDAPDCIMFRVDNGKLYEMYHVGMYRNTPAVDEVMKMHYFVTRGSDKNGKSIL